MFLIDTYLDKSKIHGVGVFSKENVNKGQINDLVGALRVGLQRTLEELRDAEIWID